MSPHASVSSSRDRRGRRRRPCAGIRDAVHAEWTKQRTLPETGWLLVATAALTIAVSVAAIAVTTCRRGAPCAADPTMVSLTGVRFGQAGVAVLAVLAVSGEYSTGMIHTTLVAIPDRLTVLAAKIVTVTLPVLGAGSIAVLGSVLAGQALLPGHGFTRAHGFAAVSLTAGPVLRAAGGSVLYLALVALLALGVAIAVRDTAVAIGLVLALLYLFPILAAAAGDPHWQRHLEQIGPMTAGLEIEATTRLRTLAISPWAGLGVLAAWAAAALLGSGLLLRSRDA